MAVSSRNDLLQITVVRHLPEAGLSGNARSQTIVALRLGWRAVWLLPPLANPEIKHRAA